MKVLMLFLLLQVSASAATPRNELEFAEVSTNKIALVKSLLMLQGLQYLLNLQVCFEKYDLI